MLNSLRYLALEVDDNTSTTRASESIDLMTLACALTRRGVFGALEIILPSASQSGFTLPSDYC